MKLQISIDDYNPGNIELAKLIKSYGLEKNTIFFIDLNGHKPREGEPLTEPKVEEQIGRLDRLGFTLGSHNIHHDNSLKGKGYEEQKWQIFESKKEIERITGKPCNHYCYNRGRSSEQIRQLVKEAGYLSARGTKVLCTKEPEDKFNTETTVHAFERKEYEGYDWNKVSMDILEWCIFNKRPRPCEFYKLGGESKIRIEPGNYFHLWAHMKEISRPGEMDKFKSILECIQSDI